MILNESFFYLCSDLNKYSRKTPAKVAFPGADFCDNDNGEEFLLVGRLKKKKKPRPVHISIRGETSGERAYEVFLDVAQSRIEQWVLIGGTEEDIVGDESFIQLGYPFELREDIKKKNTLQFGHCPNVGGGVYPCPNFFDTFLTN